MIDAEKKEIRKQIKELKKKYSLKEKRDKSQVIFSQIESLELFKKADLIMAYWSMDDEVYTHSFVQKWCQKKTIVLPSVKGDELELKVFEGIDNMIEGAAFGILEPKKLYNGDVSKIQLIIIPGIAFDNQNNRLGRGKAYYDKLLKNTGVIKIGICFDFQMVDKVPADVYDVKMDMVISDIES